MPTNQRVPQRAHITPRQLSEREKIVLDNMGVSHVVLDFVLPLSLQEDGGCALPVPHYDTRYSVPTTSDGNGDSDCNGNSKVIRVHYRVRSWQGHRLWASMNQGSRHTLKKSLGMTVTIIEDINCSSSSAPNDVKMPAHILCVSETRAAWPLMI